MKQRQEDDEEIRKSFIRSRAAKLPNVLLGHLYEAVLIISNVGYKLTALISIEQYKTRRVFLDECPFWFVAGPRFPVALYLYECSQNFSSIFAIIAKVWIIYSNNFAWAYMATENFNVDFLGIESLEECPSLIVWSI